MMRSFSCLVVLVFVALVANPVARATGQVPPHLKFVDGVVYVRGLSGWPAPSNVPDSQWKDILAVYTNEAYVKGIDQPIAGKYTVMSDGLSFEPTFPFAAGMVYH